MDVRALDRHKKKKKCTSTRIPSCHSIFDVLAGKEKKTSPSAVMEGTFPLVSDDVLSYDDLYDGLYDDGSGYKQDHGNEQEPGNEQDPGYEQEPDEYEEDMYYDGQELEPYTEAELEEFKNRFLAVAAPLVALLNEFREPGIKPGKSSYSKCVKCLHFQYNHYPSAVYESSRHGLVINIVPQNSQELIWLHHLLCNVHTRPPACPGYQGPLPTAAEMQFYSHGGFYQFLRNHNYHDFELMAVDRVAVGHSTFSAAAAPCVWPTDGQELLTEYNPKTRLRFKA